MAAAYTVVRQARQQLIKKFSTSGVIRTTSGDVTQSPMASQHSRSNRVSSFAEDPCESAQLSAEEKLVELQASKIRVNARGLRYPDDGPLPEVLPTSSDQDKNILHHRQQQVMITQLVRTYQGNENSLKIRATKR